MKNIVKIIALYFITGYSTVHAQLISSGIEKENKVKIRQYEVSCGAEPQDLKNKKTKPGVIITGYGVDVDIDLIKDKPKADNGVYLYKFVCKDGKIKGLSFDTVALFNGTIVNIYNND